MSKPTQAGKNGGNSKLEETRADKNPGDAGNKQSAAPGHKASADTSASQSKRPSKSK